MKKTFNILTDDDYDALNTKLDRIIEMLESKGQSPPLKKWLSEKETQGLLGKKATTLWKMRNKGSLEFTKINTNVFYSRESIKRLLEYNKKDAYAIQSRKNNKRCFRCYYSRSPVFNSTRKSRYETCQR